jgi:hypothetical protein
LQDSTQNGDNNRVLLDHPDWYNGAKSAFIYATVLEGAIRSQVNDGPVTTYKAGQNFSELPGDRHAVSANASKNQAGQAPRGVRGGHERDGTDHPIRELRFETFRAEIIGWE